MLFFIVVCLFLLIAIPLAHSVLRKAEQGRDVSDANTYSNGDGFYGSSASTPRDDETGPSASHNSEATACDESSPDSGFDSGSCDSGSDSSD